MPIYEYQCCKCRKVIQEEHPITEDKKFTTCDCGYIANKIISQNTFLLKGKKWAAKGKEGY